MIDSPTKELGKQNKIKAKSEDVQTTVEMYKRELEQKEKDKQ